METWIIVAVLYALIAIGTFCFITAKWNKPVFQRIWFALFWPAVLVAWIVHIIYNKWFKPQA